ncbi:MFS transporter [Pseudogulbenkiania sp. MAI-1]|uniref:MFS transporter n=1 Tax=Pseudogulbenkiania sp. MAI-1 TaxID=990370 RepID=UPI00045EBE72|nr:MFS transporter [Pseudogulbenkiania sp. MAI-1]
MTIPLSSIAIFLASFALLMCGNSLFGTLVSLQLVHAHFSPLQAGLVQSAYYGGFMLGAFGVGSLIGRIGHHRAFAAFAALASCTALGFAVSKNPLVWAVLRLAGGFCLMGVFTVLESWLNASADNSLRGRVFACYLITAYLFAGLGQLLVGLANPYGFELFSLAAGLYALSLLPITVLGQHAPPLSRTCEKPDLAARIAWVGKVYRSAPLGVWGCLAAGMVNSSFYAMGPVFMKSAGFNVQGVSYFMSASMLAALLLQWPIARLSDSVDRRRVILSVALLSAATSLALVQGGEGWLVPMVLLYVGLAFTLYGVVISHVNDLIAPEQRVTASAGLLLLFSIGGSFGPTLSSLAIASLGPSGFFLFASGVMSMLAVLTVHALLSEAAT